MLAGPLRLEPPRIAHRARAAARPPPTARAEKWGAGVLWSAYERALAAAPQPRQDDQPGTKSLGGVFWAEMGRLKKRWAERGRAALGWGGRWPAWKAALAALRGSWWCVVPGRRRAGCRGGSACDPIPCCCCCCCCPEALW